MEKHFCDRCGKEINYKDTAPCRYPEGSYTARLQQVIGIPSDMMKSEDRELYAADYVSDLCNDCQDKLTELVQVFMKNREG